MRLFTRCLEIFDTKTGIFLFNKLNGTIIFIENANFLKSCSDYYYTGSNEEDESFLEEYDFFLQDAEVKKINKRVDRKFW